MSPHAAPVRGQTLLIVEDDILPAMALRDELEDAGYEVLDLTGRRQEALSAAQAHKPELALVNIELQGHDDGIALARDLQAMGVPTLFISGQVSRARSAQTVAIGSLPKPYRASDVVLAVDHLLAHLRGDTSRPRPDALEVFDHATGAAAPGLV
jgi:DNA-binding response OmpR family regulator